MSISSAETLPLRLTIRRMLGGSLLRSTEEAWLHMIQALRLVPLNFECWLQIGLRI